MALSLKSLGASLNTPPQPFAPSAVHKLPAPNKVTVNDKSFVIIDWVEGEHVSAGHFSTELFAPVSRKSLNPMGKLKPEWEGFICKVLGLDLSALERTTPFIKERLQKYTEMLGCRPVKFVEMWNACQCKAFIPQDVKHIANSYCRGRLGRFNKNYIQHLVERKSQIKQLEEDGMLQVLPFFLYSNKATTVRDFRKQVGKGIWKQLLKNSKTRNMLIARSSVENPYRHGGETPTVQYLNSLPTGLIPTSVLQSVPKPEEASLFKRMKVVSNKRKQQRSLNIVRDTTRMNEDLGYPKLPKGHTKWTFREWEQHHTHLQELINAKKYSKDVFPWMTKSLKDKCFSFKDFTASVLDNAFDIKMEGENMSHCVASYSNHVMKKKYVVISIKNSDGKRFSTLGLNIVEDSVDKQLKVVPNQHYMKYNAHVTDRDVLSFEKIIIANINKQLEQTEK